MKRLDWRWRVPPGYFLCRAGSHRARSRMSAYVRDEGLCVRMSKPGASLLATEVFFVPEKFREGALKIPGVRVARNLGSFGFYWGTLVDGREPNPVITRDRACAIGALYSVEVEE